jgi:hypothetical protein
VKRNTSASKNFTNRNNVTFPLINCIHDPARTDRRKLLDHQIATQRLSVQFWPAIKDKMISFRGISWAHKQIIRWARKTGQEEVLIMEDDCYFFGPGAFEYYLSQKPSSYDIYLGNVFFPPTLDGNRLSDFCGLTLYFIHSRCYDKILSANEMNHLDRVIGKMELEKYVCIPMVCSQIDGYSDNKRHWGSYGKYLVGHSLYGAKTPPERNPST